ncbi:class I SAM-dependent methyltransferase [Pseudoxanthomonas indica]|uniref:Methyltransferase domain-containing protein n=1 Tax=Pseudoxanthomonas indica TaxID=428993 RepID=A0A1T5LEC4_9GAMM|nr:class I SAM-dependent methyltransferase [Pseudoxanthomonas indica]GGD34302.1 hypothetical protein GCM10007235_02670 [Pseudoxanthomonas indica]SKC74341.1 Methyltransferase domain-containing protein [Pseudoxanthomonas indica]
MAEPDRQAHAILERDSRISKADKIVALLPDLDLASCRRILEIGCGSGVISSRLAEVAPNAEVHAVDVKDNRIEFAGYHFSIVEGTHLPFPDHHFDLVISNHVIEHVGNHEAQLEHLREIARVLLPAGVGYLAVPNKWRLVEPHYRLPLLSWLPQSIADAWVRRTRRGQYYDCVPLSARSAERLFDEGHLLHQDITIPALRATLDIEHPHSPVTPWVRRFVPDGLLKLTMPVIPTLIYRLKRQPA